VAVAKPKPRPWVCGRDCPYTNARVAGQQIYTCETCPWDAQGTKGEKTVPKTISVDFDGVLHKYSKGWMDGTIYDGPMPGAKEAMAQLKVMGFDICVNTCRVGEGQAHEVRTFLRKHGITFDYVTDIKQPSFAYIDDRGLHFTDWESTLIILAARVAVANGVAA